MNAITNAVFEKAAITPQEKEEESSSAAVDAEANALNCDELERNFESLQSQMLNGHCGKIADFAKTVVHMIDLLFAKEETTKLKIISTIWVTKGRLSLCQYPEISAALKNVLTSFPPGPSNHKKCAGKKKKNGIQKDVIRVSQAYWVSDQNSQCDEHASSNNSQQQILLQKLKDAINSCEKAEVIKEVLDQDHQNYCVISLTKSTDMFHKLLNTRCWPGLEMIFRFALRYFNQSTKHHLNLAKNEVTATEEKAKWIKLLGTFKKCVSFEQLYLLFKTFTLYECVQVINEYQFKSFRCLAEIFRANKNNYQFKFDMKVFNFFVDCCRDPGTRQIETINDWEISYRIMSSIFQLPPQCQQHLLFVSVDFFDAAEADCDRDYSIDWIAIMNLTDRILNHYRLTSSDRWLHFLFVVFRHNLRSSLNEVHARSMLDIGPLMDFLFLRLKRSKMEELLHIFSRQLRSEMIVTKFNEMLQDYVVADSTLINFLRETNLLPFTNILETPQQYSSRQQENLAAVARDRESSMRGLSELQIQQAKFLQAHYIQPDEDIESALANVRTAISTLYLQNPARVIFENRTFNLPMDYWTVRQNYFNCMDHRQVQEFHRLAMESYYGHAVHTAWRFLLSINPWATREDEFEPCPFPNSSSHARYATQIVYLFRAASDVNATPNEGFTVQDRILHFLTELSLINRAHNWDRQYDFQQAEFDDMLGDSPSCFSGTNSRLAQSLIGYPFSGTAKGVYTLGAVREQMESFLKIYWQKQFMHHQHPAQVINAFDTAITDGMHGVSEDDKHLLASFNLTKNGVDEFYVQLSHEFGFFCAVDKTVVAQITAWTSEEVQVEYFGAIFKAVVESQSVV